MTGGAVASLLMHSVKRTPGHFQIEKWHQLDQATRHRQNRSLHQPIKVPAPKIPVLTCSLPPKVASTRKSKKILASTHQSTGIKDTFLKSSTRPSIQHAAVKVTYPHFLHLGVPHLGVPGVCASASPFIAPFRWSSIDACSRA